MKKTLMGLLAGVSMAGVAFAGGGDKDWSNDKPHSQGAMIEDSTQDSATSDTSVGQESELGTGGSGTMGKSRPMGEKGSMGMGHELSGTVVKTERSQVFVQHEGAIIPLKIDKSTKFEGESLKSSKDLKAGQEIRASYSIENETNNVAKSIQLSSELGQGGSGFETDVNQDVELESDVPALPEESSIPLPEEPGTQPSNPTY